MLARIPTRPSRRPAGEELQVRNHPPRRPYRIVHVKDDGLHDVYRDVRLPEHRLLGSHGRLANGHVLTGVAGVYRDAQSQERRVLLTGRDPYVDHQSLISLAREFHADLSIQWGGELLVGVSGVEPVILLANCTSGHLFSEGIANGGNILRELSRVRAWQGLLNSELTVYAYDVENPNNHHFGDYDGRYLRHQFGRDLRLLADILPYDFTRVSEWPTELFANEQDLGMKLLRAGWLSESKAKRIRDHCECLPSLVQIPIHLMMLEAPIPHVTELQLEKLLVFLSLTKNFTVAELLTTRVSMDIVLTVARIIKWYHDAFSEDGPNSEVEIYVDMTVDDVAIRQDRQTLGSGPNQRYRLV